MENKNRPAFPTETGTLYNLEGLSKREWFTGMALHGYLAGGYPKDNMLSGKEVAKECICMADFIMETLKEDK